MNNVRKAYTPYRTAPRNLPGVLIDIIENEIMVERIAIVVVRLSAEEPHSFRQLTRSRNL